MADLLILGTHPHAIEMAEIVERVNRDGTKWNLVAFVSISEHTASQNMLGLPVLSMKEAAARFSHAYLIPEYEWPDKSALPRDRLATLIDPDTFVSSTARIGLGCVIYPHCFVGSNASIGDFLFCLSGSIINHNDTLEDHITLTSNVTIAGDVHVERDCYLGQSCTVRELLRIGRGSMIGMGSVVLHNVRPNSVMVGNPARRLRSRQLNLPARVLKATKRRLRQQRQPAATSSLPT